MRMWKDLSFIGIGSRFNLDLQSIGIGPLLKGMLQQSEGHLSNYAAEGTIKDELVEDDGDPGAVFSEVLAQMGGRLLVKGVGVGDGTNHIIFLWKDSMVEAEFSSTWMRVAAVSYNEKFVQGIKKFFDEQWAPARSSGHIYAIVRQGQHLGLSSIGNAGVPLVEGNYHPEVLAGYKFAIRDLQSTNPSGRIVIMKGAPGTGKTHLVRAMLLEVPDAMFVLVSPDMVSSLAGPELLPLLLSYKGGTKGPIILVLEDADKCLVTRASDNINSIQSLLNLGDGILGSLLDLRIVATTNADELKMEAAILRPGRLSKLLDVGFLDQATAKGIFRRLLPAAPFPEKLSPSGDFQMTLAEAYSLARQAGWASELRDMESNKEKEAPDYD